MDGWMRPDVVVPLRVGRDVVVVLDGVERRRGVARRAAGGGGDSRPRSTSPRLKKIKLKPPF